MRKGLLLGLGSLLLPPALVFAQNTLPAVLPTAPTQQSAAVVEKETTLPPGLPSTIIQETIVPTAPEPAPPAGKEPVPADPKEQVPADPKEIAAPAPKETAPVAPKSESATPAVKESLPPDPKESAAPAAPKGDSEAPAASETAAPPVKDKAPAPKETAPAAPKAGSEAPTNLPIATQPPPDTAPGMALPPSTTIILTPGKSGPGMPVMGVPGASCVDGSCGSSCCCNPCGACCCDCSEPSQRVWVNAEFLLWWTKNAPVSTPLLTAATNTSDPTSGALGSANTAVLLGGQSYGLGTRYGGRFTVGGWIDPDAQLGVEASYLFIAPSSTTKQVGSDGGPASQTVGVPLNVPGSGEQFREVGFPGGAGGAFLTLQNSLQSAELNGLFRMCSNDSFTVSGLVGARYIYFKETMDFGIGAAGGPGSTFTSLDHFEGMNNFYGGQLGLRGQYQCGNFFVNGTAKLALGAVYQTVNINGGSVVTSSTGNLSFPAGVFTQTSNIGHASTTRFAVAPEVGLNTGYDITRNIRAYVGYTFLYINNVARPGQQLDHSINLNQNPITIPGATSASVPAFPFNHTDFWAQGLNFGLALKW